MSQSAVQFDQVSKRFPGAQALSDVSLEIAAGSCHALCGENGAGKSTLGKILAGIYAPDGGRLLIHGREVHFTSPRDALAAGVGMVHQELAFCDNLSVAENLCLSSLPSRGGLVVREEMERRADAMLAETGTELDVSRPFGVLAIGQRQMVQIAAAVGGGAKIIVFDEPTSSLSQVEAERLFELIERLKARGVTCIYVSHRMPEIFQLCDTVTVLRDGRHVATRPIEGLTEADLVQMMIGRPLADYFPRHKDAEGGEEVLRVERLTVPGKFEDVSFTLHAGEIVGLAGLMGAGRSEVASALFGIEHPTSGRIFLRSKEVRITSPAHAIASGSASFRRIASDRASCCLRADCTTRRCRSLGDCRGCASSNARGSAASRESSSTGCACARRAWMPPSPVCREGTSRRSCSRNGSRPTRRS